MINVTYLPDPDTLRASQGWGRCVFTIEDRAFWYAGTAQKPEPLLWTWVDLLNHLGCYWLDINTEAPWPNDRLASAMQEGKDFWALAEDDWADMPAETADQEEAQMLNFTRPRNLAHALQGLTLPAIYCFRQGKDMLICPEGMPALQMNGHDFAHLLEKLGHQIDQGIGYTTHPRAQEAQHNWRNRCQNQTQRQIHIATGMSANELKELQQGQTAEEFWGLSDSANDYNFSANALLAAARMIGPLRLKTEQKQGLLAQLREQSVNPQALKNLQALSGHFVSQAQRRGKPHEQGYQLAKEVRQHFQVSAEQAFPIAQVIEYLALSVHDTPFGCPGLLAMALWGQSGPAILLNSDPDANTKASHVRRILLAHEFCHLLLDRDHALPVVDVLATYTTTTTTEQRAKAFAAELLLPRESAAKAYGQQTTLREAIRSLSQQFDVSPKVAKTQILNSGRASPDDEEEIRAQLRQDRFPG